MSRQSAERRFDVTTYEASLMAQATDALELKGARIGLVEITTSFARSLARRLRKYVSDESVRRPPRRVHAHKAKGTHGLKRSREES